MEKQNKFAVIGAGSWGTAIACLIARAQGQVLLYAIEQSAVDEINSKKTNSKYLDDIVLPSGIVATSDMKSLKDCKYIVIATPSGAFEVVLKDLLKIVSHDTVLLIATKGMCQLPLQLFSERVEQECINSYGFLSGPNFAKEVAQGKFASVTIASKHLKITKMIVHLLATKDLDVSVSDDIITVQIAGMIKNIVAIKSGILMAQGHGDNARAWLVSKALEEIAAIAKDLGGCLESLSLPAVVGDLVLTSYSTTSRNTKFGYEFCKHNFAKDFLVNYPSLVEGANAARLLKQFLGKKITNYPIISSVAELVT